MKYILIISLLFSFTADAQMPIFHAHNQTSTPLMLDGYTDIHAVWSLRKVYSSYSGNSISVVNSSLSVLDIGFVNNFTDTVSLKSFIGSGNGYVLYTYSQHGDDTLKGVFDTTQLPRIAYSGNLVYNNGNLAIHSPSKIIDAQHLALSTTSFSIYGVFAYSNATGNNGQSVSGYFDQSASFKGVGFPRSTSAGSNTIQAQLYDGTTTYGTGASASVGTGKFVQSIFYDQVNLRSRVNASDLTTSSGDGAGISATLPRYRLSSASSTGSGALNVYFFEAIVFSAENYSNRTTLHDLIDNYYSIY